MNWCCIFKPAHAALSDRRLQNVAAVTLNYGRCIQTIVDFMIVAVAVFLLVKGVNSMRRKEDDKKPA